MYNKKYHKKLGFEHEKLLQLFILTVNRGFWRLSSHAKKRILERIGEVEKIGLLIREYKIKYDDIIEYTFINGHIEKILVRINYNQNYDLIIVISYDNMIITCYLNKKADNHYTINKRQYQTV